MNYKLGKKLLRLSGLIKQLTAQLPEITFRQYSYLYSFLTEGKKILTSEKYESVVSEFVKELQIHIFKRGLYKIYLRQYYLSLANVVLENEIIPAENDLKEK